MILSAARLSPPTPVKSRPIQTINPTSKNIVRADEILAAFVELQQAIHKFAVSLITTSLKSP
jgi:hypothetical protein